MAPAPISAARIGAHRIARRQARQAPHSPAVPGRARLSRQADGRRQCRELAQAAEVVIYGARSSPARHARLDRTKDCFPSPAIASGGIYEYPFGCGCERAGGLRRARRRFRAVSGPSGVCLTPDEFHRAPSPSGTSPPPAPSWCSTPSRTISSRPHFARFFAHEELRLLHALPRRHVVAARSDGQDRGRRGSHYEVNELMRLSELMKRTSPLRLGQTAGHPFNDAWRKFRPAFESACSRATSRPHRPAGRARARRWAATGRGDHLARIWRRKA